MHMPYITNPHLPRLRMEAAKLVLEKDWSTRQTARYTGFNQKIANKAIFNFTINSILLNYILFNRYF